MEQGAADHRTLVPVLVFVGLMVAVISSLGAPLIPEIAARDEVALGTAEWVLTAAVLTGALATPLLGRLADGAHQRRVVAGTLGTVLVGCVLAAVAPGFWVLVAGRALQGVGLGILPVNMAVARRMLPPARAAAAIATLSVSTAIGAGLGYPLTAAVAQVVGIRGAYWFGAAVVAVALATAWTALPARTAARARPFDWAGAALVSIGVVAIVVWLSEVGRWGAASATSVAVAATAAGALGAWVVHELRTSAPLVELRHLRTRSVLTADLSGFLMSMAMYLILPVLVEFIQVPPSAGFGFGASVLVSGFLLLPLSVGTFVASRLLIPVERRIGVRALIPLGGLLFALAAASFALTHRALWQAFGTMGLVGLALGFTFAALPGLIIRSVPHEETGSATGLYQLLRNVGLAAGSALSAAILRAHTAPGHLVPALGGFTTAMAVAAGLCLTAGALGWLLTGAAGGRIVPEDPGAEAVMVDEAVLEATGAMLTDDGDLEPGSPFG